MATGVRSGARRALDRAVALADQHETLLLAAFSAVFLGICALISATKMFWYDEFAAYYPATLPFGSMIQFFGRGLDMHTPAASAAIYAAIKLFGDHPVTDRLPNAIAFLVMCLCIYRFVARRCPKLYAFAALIFPAVSGVMYYATEARGYALVLGFSGLALVCWQAAAEKKYRVVAVPGLFLSLAAALACHYFAAFLWVPFGLAELTRSWRTRRVDVPIWLALLLSPSVILLFLPAMRISRAAYLSGIWAKPHLSEISNAYLSTLTPAFVPVFAGALFYFLLAPKFSRPDPDWHRPPLSETVLAGALALMPAIAGVSSLALGTYVWRYTLYSIAGISIFLAFAMCAGLKADRLAALILTVASLGWFASKSATTVSSQMAEGGGIRTSLGRLYRSSPWIRALEGNSLPIMASPAVLFMPLQYYAPESVRRRVIYAADRDLGLKYTGSDTSELNMIRFSWMLPLRVVAFNDFVAANRHFLLAIRAPEPSWQSSELLARGAQLKLLKRSDPYFVFEVTIP